MQKTPVRSTLVSAILLTGCGEDAPSTSGANPAAAQASSTTAGTLSGLTGHLWNDEVEYGSIEAQAAAASAVVVGPVVDITDLGPADPSGSVTHVFRLTVKVKESIKGDAGDTVSVTTLGVGNVGEMRRSLTPDAGLWMLTSGGGGELVPVEAAAVLFEQDAVVVAPLAETRVKPDAESLGEAIAKSREGARR